MSDNLTKREIVLEIYKETDHPQKVIQDVVQLAFEEVAKALKQGRNVELRNFGVFEVKIQKSRIGRNPHKPEKDVIIPDRATVRFKASKDLKKGLLNIDLKQLR